MSSLSENANLRAPTMIQLGRRLLAVIGLAVAAVLVVWMILAWQQVRDGQLQRMEAAVKLLAGHADNYFAIIEYKLQDSARELRAIDPLTNPAAALSTLQALKNALPDVLGAALVQPDGRILVATAAPGQHHLPNLRTDPGAAAELDRDLRARRFSIGRPQLARLRPQWVIHLRLAVRDRDGKPRYLIQVGVELQRQQALWRSLELPADSAIGLLRDDGYLVSRLPADNPAAMYSRQNRGGVLYQTIARQPGAGVYDGTVMADGTRRFGAYQRLSHYPEIHAFLSQDRATLGGLWWRAVRFPLSVVCGTLLMSFLAFVGLTRRYGRRMHAIEEHLAFADRTPPDALPSSGVQEIDMLVAALAQSREKLRAVAQNRERLLLTAAEAGTYVVRECDGVFLSVDDTFAGMLGRPEAQLIGVPWQRVVTDGEPAGASSPGVMDLASRIVSVSVPGDARARWLSVAEYREVLLDGEVVRHGLAIDVSDRERLLAQVNTQSQRLQALWQLAMSRGKSDREKMRLMLRMALDALQMDAVLANELRGDQIVVRELADDLRLFEVGQSIATDSSLCRGSLEARECFIVSDLRADTDLYRHPLAVTVGIRGFASVPIFTANQLYGTMAFMRRAPLGDDFGPDERAFMELLAAWFGQILIEESQRVELERMAMTDGLTRLTNRRAAEVRFQEEFARARRDRAHFSIAVCDLDRFKLINDQYGHDVGDQVLLQVAEIMKSHLREGDWVARWGGEEFIIFLHRADSAAALTAMERLRLAIRGTPVSTAHGPLEITISIGIGTFRGEGDLASALSEADGCLYEAKRGGRDAVVTSESSRSSTLWRAGMLQHALLEHRIVPAYQVIVDLRTGKPVADEALARLIEPDGRIVPASEFIDAAEGINFIHVVDEVVARQAIQRCAQHARTGIDKRGFAHFINLSPQFLARRDLVQSLLHQATQQCTECGLVCGSARPMVLEITERQLIGNFESLAEDLQPLLDFGFRLALDDFGSGYSSFLYLATLPVSFLKIEGWMVRNLRHSQKVRGMVRSVIELARDQGIITIAECVEDAPTAETLRELGADWAQGWHFGRPVCEVEPEQLLSQLKIAAR